MKYLLNNSESGFSIGRSLNFLAGKNPPSFCLVSMRYFCSFDDESNFMYGSISNSLSLTGISKRSLKDFKLSIVSFFT